MDGICKMICPTGYEIDLRNANDKVLYSTDGYDTPVFYVIALLAVSITGLMKVNIN